MSVREAIEMVTGPGWPADPVAPGRPVQVSRGPAQAPRDPVKVETERRRARTRGAPVTPVQPPILPAAARLNETAAVERAMRQEGLKYLNALRAARILYEGRLAGIKAAGAAREVPASATELDATGWTVRDEVIS